VTAEGFDFDDASSRVIDGKGTGQDNSFSGNGSSAFFWQTLFRSSDESLTASSLKNFLAGCRCKKIENAFCNDRPDFCDNSRVLVDLAF